MTERRSVSLAILGRGGAGALTAGNLLLEAASAGGWQGLLARTVGPQIRGGEAAALLRLGTKPIECLADQFDLLIGIDWLNAHRFGAEIQAGPRTVVISDPRGGELPPAIAASGARIFEIPIKNMAKTIPEGRGNMIALGMAARLLGLHPDLLFSVLEKRLGEKGEAAVVASRAGIRAGYDAAAGLEVDVRLAAP